MIREDDFRNVMALILSFGHDFSFRSSVVEKRIGKSEYFIAVENNLDEYILYASHKRILSSFYYDVDTTKWKYKIYNEYAWLSELYLRIQREMKITFEAIFLVLPILEGLKLFRVYHEMNFEHSIELFKEMYNKHSIMWNAMKRRDVSISELSNNCGLSYSMISALRQRKKNINKVAAQNLLSISKYLGVRIETLLSDAK